ncbi:DUF2933 domain-containing protein [Candidatus Gottesmanbacteria bacterium]|nr:DUF2933 domain-containing protein [Candidatus Gottesmanbacteria bacterium]
MKKYLPHLLCALPFIGVLLWFIAGKNIGNMVTIGLVLACPLSHLFFMNHGHDDHQKKKGGEKYET